MSFKDEYKKSYDEIVPDQKFINQLSRKLEQEQKKKYRGNYGILVLVTGVFLVLFVSLTAYHIMTGKPEPSHPVQIHTGSALQTPSAESGIFSTPKWYSAEDSPEKILSDFSKRLSDQKQLQDLYFNQDNDFTDETCVSEEKWKQLALRIASARFLSEEPMDSKRDTYYMAQFENGDIIKFVVMDNHYFKFLDLDYVYELGE